MAALPERAMKLRRVCVFCGANSGSRASFAQAAREFGALLVRHGIELVYGGGNVGLMGAVADGALEARGHVIGVIPRALVDKELAHKGAQEMRVVATMHERKALMAELSDGFVALPGGFGTLDEICEVLTWSQLGFHAKPCAFLDVDGYWRPLQAMLDAAVEHGFLRSDNRELALWGDDAGELLERMQRWRPAHQEQWIGRGEI
jgi:hypothetical protein